MNKLFIFYGSQTGCAESIASRIFSDGIERQFDVKKLQLDDFQKANVIAEDNTNVVIICSTTGNGDAPDNAGKFYRYIKRKTQPSTLLSKIKYTVLGLGDTNYDKFCFMGKTIDKRMAELGAQRFYNLGVADEAMGLEDTVESWIEGLWQILDSTSATESIPQSEHNVSSASNKKMETSTRSDLLSNMSDLKVSSSSDTVLHSEDCNISFYSPGIVSYEKMFDLSDAVAFGNDPKSLPRLQTCQYAVKEVNGVASNVAITNGNSLNIIDSNTHVGELQQNANAGAGSNNDEIDMEPVYTSSSPFFAKIRSAKYLTSVSSEKKVIWIELDLGNSGISYIPGDCIGIKCPNRKRDVEVLLARLGWDGNQMVEIETVASTERRIGSTTPQAHDRFRTPCSIREILLHNVDLLSSPSKSALRTFASYCTDNIEKSQMLYLCSKLGASQYKEFITSQQLNIVELLLLFPSCSPPLEQLLSIARQLMPRYYSIASSPLADSKKLSIALTVVQNFVGTSDEANEAKRILRYGLCSNWLENLCQPILHKKTDKSKSTIDVSNITVPIFLRPTTDFRLPTDLSNPLVLVGPGTGVAPFIGFLEHRKQQLSEQFTKANGNSPIEESNLLDISLFFGCRRRDEDWLFQDEMKMYMKEKVLKQLYTAFSREDTDGKKHYVQDDLRKAGSLLVSLLMEKNAYVFVCGDGMNMARDVHTALTDILLQHGKFSTVEDASSYLKELMAAHRYVRDIWS